MDDLISRQAAIEALGEMPEVWEEDDDEGRGEQNQWYMDKAAIEAVPTAEKKGKWTEVEICDGKVIEQWQSMKCDQCERYHTTPYLYYVRKARYCPNCGARMEESDE